MFSQTPGLAEMPPLLQRLQRVERWGLLDSVRGTALTVTGFGATIAVGDRVLVSGSSETLGGEVVAFAGDRVTVMLEGRGDGLTPGARVVLAEPPALYPCAAWLGRVVDGLGN